MSAHCYRCGEAGHLDSACPRTGVVRSHVIQSTAPAPHEHECSISIFASSMVCRDCSWHARGDNAWLACQAVVHLSERPGHRLAHSTPLTLRFEDIPSGEISETPA